jgi:hypothetical protein
MTLLVANGSEILMMENFLNKTAPQDLILKLYSSDTTPAETDTSATYTETAGGGYAEVALVAATWTVTGGNPTTASYPEQTFSFTGAAGNVYGYYVVQAISGDLMWAERFPSAPLNIQNNGDEIRITLQLTLE